VGKRRRTGSTALQILLSVFSEDPGEQHVHPRVLSTRPLDELGRSLDGVGLEIPIASAGAMPTVAGDVNGDGVVDISDYTALRARLGKRI
jgi:hypothetical protein